mmetsp:Transcript_18805/g.38595  ORF Transcript_18805/g.38595 Transcript_18805/m.38595 type:complete len:226 (-) Transcript_18805:1130-1807(-)
MIPAPFSQSLIALPNPDTRKRRHRKDSDLLKRSVSMNLPITEMALLPIYLRSTNIDSSPMNSRIISFCWVSWFGVSASSSPFLSFSSSSVDAEPEMPPFKVVEDIFLGRARTVRHRRSMWLTVAQVSSEIEFVRRSLVTNISSLRRPFTANAPESEIKQVLNIANTSSINVSSLKVSIQRRQMCMQSSMKGSNVVSIQEGSDVASSDFCGSPDLGDRKRSKSVGS